MKSYRNGFSERKIEKSEFLDDVLDDVKEEKGTGTGTPDRILGISASTKYFFTYLIKIERI